MSLKPVNYLGATRHPWPCLWFVLPLLAVYEGGVLYVGGEHGQALRNGADAWLRRGLQEMGGVVHPAAAPVLVLGLLVVWCAGRWRDRPGEVPSVCTGMLVESLFFACGLWGLSRGFGPLLESLGIKLKAGASPSADAVSQLVTYVGAGIYEEVIFRLGAYAGLLVLMRLSQVPKAAAVGMAAVLSGVVFAAAHHVGPSGESVESFVFLFRTLAGVYFALIYQFRGFGVAVGAHAGYDLLVGVMMARPAA
jgi:membrane protease YdiL (CAAX protease family)